MLADDKMREKQCFVSLIHALRDIYRLAEMKEKCSAPQNYNAIYSSFNSVFKALSNEV
jgi:hypothetical protein